MSLPMIAPRELVERKPPHGAPCTRCGLCCIATLCDLARSVFGDRPGPCPALRFDGQLSVCGLVAAPERFASPATMAHGREKVVAAAGYLIGTGTGCDSRINGEPINAEFNEALAAMDRRTIDEAREAKRIWAVP